MKKTALLKSSFREIKNSPTRFLSILGIIFLGVAFFVGIGATGPDMEKSADDYYEKLNLADLSIISSLGLDDTDVKELESVNQIDAIEPQYFLDLNLPSESSVIRLIGYNKAQKLNHYQINEGRLPEKSGEIALDEVSKRHGSYRLGDTIKISKEDSQEQLKKTSYKIVGFVNSPEFIETIKRGTTTVGNGSIDFFAVVSDKDFDLETYARILVSFKDVEGISAYSNQYDSKMKKHTNAVEKALAKRPEARLQEIKQSAENELSDAQKKVDDGKAVFKEAEEKLAAAKTQLDTGKAAAAQLQQAQAVQQLAALEAELATGEAEYQKNAAELASKQQAELPKLEEAQEKIDQQRKDLAEMSPAEYFFNDRTSNPGYSEYRDNASRISSLATVFPIIFFLIAALVSLTTMTRMVEEKRNEIGTYKALGYTNWEIAQKFLIYSLLAGVVGTVLGLALGFYLFPTIIINAYGQMYNITEFTTPWYLSYGLIGAVVSLICTVGVAMLVLRIDLLSTPAKLLRPKAPKAGKRILLERLTPLWRRLSFIQKVTMRNLFRYKSRMLMTIFGIAGCTSMILTGFGLRDSVSDIVPIQFDKLWHYQAIVTFDDSEKQRDEDYQKTLEKTADFKDAMPVNMENYTLSGSEHTTQDVTVYVPETPDKIADFLLLNDRVSGKKYQLSDDGAIINEKLAKLFRLKVGDTIPLENADNQTFNIKISAIAENYTGHFVYVTPEYYQEVFKKTPKYNADFLLYNKNLTNEKEQQIADDLMEQSGVINVSFLSDSLNTLDDTTDTLNLVVWILIISAGLLAFIVLYNLNNINISERIRELSTIKVLGFYNNEVTMYVYRENILLTILGVGLGLLLGVLEHMYVLQTVEVDIAMFSPVIHWLSYVYSALITVFFSVVVGIVMYFKLKHVDMIEALKSNE